MQRQHAKLGERVVARDLGLPSSYAASDHDIAQVGRCRPEAHVSDPRTGSGRRRALGASASLAEACLLGTQAKAGSPRPGGAAQTLAGLVRERS